RRRHTRSDRDWSSDVCSSDLEPAVAVAMTAMIGVAIATVFAVAVAIVTEKVLERPSSYRTLRRVEDAVGDDEEIARVLVEELVRSEERRVGKECRVRGWG